MSDTNNGEGIIESFLNNTDSDILIQRYNGTTWVGEGTIGKGQSSGRYTSDKLKKLRFVTQDNKPVYIRLIPREHDDDDVVIKEHIDGEIGHPQGDDL